MSIKFQKEIFNDGKNSITINFSGINDSNSTNKNSIKLNIYVYRIEDLKHVFSASLDYPQIKELYAHIDTISLFKDEEPINNISFIEAKESDIELLEKFKIIDSPLIKLILDKVEQKNKLRLIIEALTEGEIQNLHASIRQSIHKKAIRNLLNLLALENSGELINEVKIQGHLLEYQAGQPEKIFQNWIEKNLWTLGIDYIKKHPARQIGINSESDLIMETTDGYIDLVELKRPKFDLFLFDESHKSYYPSKELSKVIGQCLQYLKILDEYKLILEKSYKFKILKPRIKIIVGRSNEFSDHQSDTLRMLNSSLNHIEIITYDYLVKCGENIISYYDAQLEKTGQNEETLTTMS